VGDDFGFADILGGDEVVVTVDLFSRRGTWRASTCQDRAREKAAASSYVVEREAGAFFIDIGWDWARLLRAMEAEVEEISGSGAITTRAVPEGLALEIEMVASIAAAAAFRRWDSSAAVALERRRTFSTLYASSASLWALTKELDCQSAELTSSSTTSSRRLNEEGLGAIWEGTAAPPWTWLVRGGIVFTAVGGAMMDVDMVK